MTTETQEPETTEVAAGDAGGEEAAAESTRPGAFDRYVVPLLMPVAIGATVLFWVLNLSRILLAAEGTGAVIAGIVITVVILGGAATLAAAPRLKSSSASLMMSGALVVVLIAGLVTIGAAEEDKAEGEVSLGEPIATVAVESGNLYFKPEELGPVPPGVIQIDVDNVAGGHTIRFEDPLVEVEKNIDMPTPGAVTGKAKFATPGTYVFFCDIPGHRAAGMEGIFTVEEGATPPEAGAEATPTSAA
ncbi:MAG: plastocyanin/azurin family copper-binding protein [Acidimicrobiia bacterium]|nr:plastocyanin/azurin family copper-binding protein [Acidimicrobiia bacterium]